MVDELKTSDEYIVGACKDSEVFEIEYEFKKTIQEKFSRVLEESAAKLFSRWVNKPNNDIYQ